MRAYEFAIMPVRVGVQPVKWFGGLVVNQATQAARSNVLEVWRKPWENEVRENLQDARSQRDYSRAEEQRALQTCMQHLAPRTAEEYEALAAEASVPTDNNQIDDLLGP